LVSIENHQAIVNWIKLFLLVGVIKGRQDMLSIKLFTSFG